MTHTSTEQPEALRLADALRDGQYSLYQERAATEAELRRLHARVQELEFRRDIASACFRNISTASQAQRVPLSDDQIDAAWEASTGGSIVTDDIRAFARWIYGITKEKQG